MAATCISTSRSQSRSLFLSPSLSPPKSQGLVLANRPWCGPKIRRPSALAGIVGAEEGLEAAVVALVSSLVNLPPSLVSCSIAGIRPDLEEPVAGLGAVQLAPDRRFGAAPKVRSCDPQTILHPVTLDFLVYVKKVYVSFQLFGRVVAIWQHYAGLFKSTCCIPC